MASPYDALGKSFPASQILGFWEHLPGAAEPQDGPWGRGLGSDTAPKSRDLSLPHRSGSHSTGIPGALPSIHQPQPFPRAPWKRLLLPLSLDPPFPAPPFPGSPFPAPLFPAPRFVPGHPREIQALPVQSHSQIPKGWEQNWSFHSPSPPALNFPGHFPGPTFSGKNSSVEKGDGKRQEFADLG